MSLTATPWSFTDKSGALVTGSRVISSAAPATGTAVLILHGVHQRSALYLPSELGGPGHTPLVSALAAAGHAVFLYDALGFGERSPQDGGAMPALSLDEGFSFDARAAIGVVREREDVRHLHVFGHSLGGLVAAHIATPAPPAPPVDGWILSAPSLSVAPDFEGATGRLVEWLVGGAAAARPGLQLAPFDARAATNNAEFAELWEAECGARGFDAGYVSACVRAQRDIEPHLAMFGGGAPVLLMTGPPRSDPHNHGGPLLLRDALSASGACLYVEFEGAPHELAFEPEDATTPGTNRAVAQIVSWLDDIPAGLEAARLQRERRVEGDRSDDDSSSSTIC